MSRTIVCGCLIAMSSLRIGVSSWAVQLAYNLKSGEQLTYRFSQTGKTRIQFEKTAPQDIQTSAEVTNIQHVTELDSSGNAILELRFKEGKVTATAPGKGPLEMPFKFPVLKLTLSRSGSVLSSEVVKQEEGRGDRPSAGLTNVSSNSLNMSQFFGQMSALGFPQKDLAMGESWTQMSRFTTATREQVEVTTHSTLKRITEVRGYLCAEIETTATFPMKASFNLSEVGVRVDGDYALRFVSHFAVDAGRLVDLTGSAEVTQKILLSESKDTSPDTDQQAKGASTRQATARSNIDFSMTLR